MARFKGVRKLSKAKYEQMYKAGTLDDGILYVTPDIPAEALEILKGEVAPTSDIVGEVGQFYLDTVAKKLYQCVGVTTDGSTSTYEWQVVGAGVSQEEFNKLVNNEVQIKSSSNGFLAGGGKSVFGGGVAIGYNAEAGNNSCVAIGQNSYSRSGDGCAIGYYAKARSQNGNMQFGYGTNDIDYTVQFNKDNIYNYNTHTLTVQNIEQNGNSVYGILSGTSAPTSSTVGAVGQFYLDTSTKMLYQCVEVDSDTSTYIWKNIYNTCTVDTELSTTSENTVQNKVIASAIYNSVELANSAITKNNEQDTAINTEITNRTNADTSLQNQINTKASKRVTLFSGSASSVTISNINNYEYLIIQYIHGRTTEPMIVMVRRIEGVNSQTVYSSVYAQPDYNGNYWGTFTINYTTGLITLEGGYGSSTLSDRKILNIEGVLYE